MRDVARLLIPEIKLDKRKLLVGAELPKLDTNP